MSDTDNARIHPQATETRPADDIVFHGRPGTPAIVAIEHDGNTIGVLAHHVRHSPGGFRWGYRGSGPHELGRCLLAAALGDDAHCGRCQGTGLVPDGIYDQDRVGPAPTRPCRCGDGISVPTEVYGAFVAEVIAHWPTRDHFRITAGAIRQWVTRHYGTR